MQTVLRTLERAYSKIQVKQDGIDLSESEKADGLSELNAFMWVNDADGLGIGWSDVSTVNDDCQEAVETPDGVARGTIS